MKPNLHNSLTNLPFSVSFIFQLSQRSSTFKALSISSAILRARSLVRSSTVLPLFSDTTLLLLLFVDFEGGEEGEDLVGEVTFEDEVEELFPFCLFNNQEIKDFNSGE